MADNTDSERPCWIDTIEPEHASAGLTEMYQQLGVVHNKIHNLYRAFSLQPKPLIAADQHYRDILHNKANHSDPWFLELLATQVAIYANCHYAMMNHGANFKSLLGDEIRGEKMLDAIRSQDLDNQNIFTQKQSAILKYGEKLCRNPESMTEHDIALLRAEGVTDTEILEAVQATACFAYWVRFINALGIQLGNETVGLFDEQGKRPGKV